MKKKPHVKNRECSEAEIAFNKSGNGNKRRKKYHLFIYFSRCFCFDMTVWTLWQFTKQSAGSPERFAKHPCHSNPPSLASCHFLKFVFDTTPASSLIALFTAARRGLEHGKGRLDHVDVKLQHSWALIVGVPHKSSKASESGTNAPSSLHYPIIQIQQPITPLLPFPSQPRSCPFRLALLESCSSCEPALLPSFTIYIYFLSRYPYHSHSIRQTSSLRFASLLARQAPPKYLSRPYPSSTAPYLRVCRIVSIMRFDVNSI